ncbi:MAG: type II toxin-antitoxin system HicB family antitoxin [Alphaproteobacteria bacterium]|nr:type II toxin-antitoxin system HicB family antitoxin [Alphaproteobacteria bacterium]
MTTYTAFIRKQEGSCYGVDFPDFPGCISAGDTVEEAIVNGREALSAHIAFMQDDGDPIPEPLSVDAAMARLDNEDGDFLLAASIQVPVERISVRVTMTMDKNLLREVDRYAKSQGYTRSAFVAEACRRIMG